MKVKWWHIALVLALLLAFLSPLASGSPDGLERVAGDEGFIEEAEEPPYQVMGDYLFPGLDNEVVSTILAGIIGTVVIFGLAYCVSLLLRRRTRRIRSIGSAEESDSPPPSG